MSNKKKIDMQDMSNEDLRTVAEELNKLKTIVAHMGDAAFNLWSELDDIETSILREEGTRA